MTASRSDSCLDEVNSQKRLSEAGIRLPSPGTIMCSRYQAVHLYVFGPPPNPVAWRMAVVEKGRSYRPGGSSRITDLLTATSLRGLAALMLPLRVRCLRRAGWRARRGTTLYLDDHVYCVLVTAANMALSLLVFCFHLLSAAGAAVLPGPGSDLEPRVPGSSPGRPSCKVIPGDARWPSAARWAELNQTIGGRLIAAKPAASVCHVNPFGVYDATACSQLQANWDRPETQ